MYTIYRCTFWSSQYLLWTTTVPCVWKKWSPWHGCTVTCGGGTQQRTREQIPALYNGPNCEGPSRETMACHLEECAGGYITLPVVQQLRLYEHTLHASFLCFKCMIVVVSLTDPCPAGHTYCHKYSGCVADRDHDCILDGDVSTLGDTSLIIVILLHIV